MNAIIINRVSDEHQLEGYSLDVQEAEGKKYAQQKGFKILKVFSFQETASKYLQRKIFNEIISLIEKYTKTTALAVIGEKYDRVYRNHLNSAQIVHYIESGKIELHFYKEGRILTKNSPPSDFFLNDVMTSVNQYASRNISAEARKGMFGKAKDGWLPHKPPIGYVNVATSERTDKNKRRSIIEPAPWGEDLIQRMYRLRADGHSLALVRQKVIEEGLVPTDRIARFHISLVEKIFKNCFYMGEFIWGGERFTGKHRPFVSKKLWEEVQQTFISKAVAMIRARKKRGVFSGFLKCACGCTVTYDPKDKPSGRHYEYYRCSNGRGIHDKLKYTSEDRIFEQLSPAIESISISERLAKDIAKALNKAEEKAKAAHRRNAEDLNARLKEMEEAEDKVYDDFKKGVLDDEGYRRQFARVRAKREQLGKVLCEAQADITGAVLVVARKILELAQNATELYLRRSTQERREFLEKILSNPVLEGVTVRYELKKPFRILSEMASSPTWGG